jgi:hypothetical protein
MEKKKSSRIEIISKYKNMNLPTLETVKRSSARGLISMVVSGLGLMVLVPFAPKDFKDFLPYGYAILFAFCVGAIQGLIKFITGYIKYDK